MWFKLNESDGTCLGLNREIAYAFLILQEYSIGKQDKYAASSPSLMNYKLKKLYHSLKNNNQLEKEVR